MSYGNCPETLLDCLLIILNSENKLEPIKKSIIEMVQTMKENNWNYTIEEVKKVIESNNELFIAIKDKYFLSDKGSEKSMNVSWY